MTVPRSGRASTAMIHSPSRHDWRPGQRCRVPSPATASSQLSPPTSPRLTHRANTAGTAASVLPTTAPPAIHPDAELRARPATSWPEYAPRAFSRNRTSSSAPHALNPGSAKCAVQRTSWLGSHRTTTRSLQSRPLLTSVAGPSYSTWFAVVGRSVLIDGWAGIVVSPMHSLLPILGRLLQEGLTWAGGPLGGIAHGGSLVRGCTQAPHKGCARPCSAWGLSAGWPVPEGRGPTGPERWIPSARNGWCRGIRRKKFTECAVIRVYMARRTFFGPSTLDGPRAISGQPAESTGPRLGAGFQDAARAARGRSLPVRRYELHGYLRRRQRQPGVLVRFFDHPTTRYAAAS
jgi:hypothetical protein